MGEASQTNMGCLRSRLQAALTDGRDKSLEPRNRAIRLALCAIKDLDAFARREDGCVGCEDTEIAEVLQTLVTERLAAAQEHEAEGRIVEAEAERDEAAFLEGFLPQPLSGAELREAVASVVSDLKAASLKDVGRCVTALKARYPGRLTPAKANAAIRNALAS
jgi:uncharacterized protein YqeY